MNEEEETENIQLLRRNEEVQPTREKRERQTGKERNTEKRKITSEHDPIENRIE